MSRRLVTKEIDDPLRRRRYENPPVIEAVARFRWSVPIDWNFTIPGVLLEHLKDLYPGEPKAQAVLQAGTFATAEPADGSTGMGPQAGFQLRAGAQKILFSDTAGTRLVGVSADGVYVHGMQPYEGWESLEQRLLAGVDRVNKALGKQSSKYSEVGIRYVNKVEISDERVQFEDYLTIGLTLPAGFPPAVNAFFDRAEMRYPEDDSTLAFTWASTDAPPGSSAFILDLDLVASLPEPVDLKGATNVLGALKRKEGRAFEALLQDRLREKFVELD